MKRLLCLVLSLMMVLGACSALATEYPLVVEKAEFRLTARVRPLHGNLDDMELFKRIEELTNIHIDWDQIPQAEYDEKKNLLLAAGSASSELPDGFFGKYSLSSSDIVTYGSQGVLIPLNDLIEQYAPNLTALFEAHPEIKGMVTAPDGNIYSTPYVQEGEDGTIASNMMINVTWLERLGLEKPTTMDDLQKVLIAFRDQDANGNGDPSDEIPMTFKFNGSQRDIAGLFGAYGYPDTAVDGANHMVVDNGKVVFVPVTEGYKTACKALYENFFSQGLIDMEGFTMDKKTYNAQNQGDIANIGVFFCWNSFDLGTKYEHEYEPLPPLLGPDGTTSWPYSPTSTMMATGFSITNVCENPELLMQWVDTFYDPYWSMQCDLGPVGINLIDNGDGTYAYADTPEGMSYDEFRSKEAYSSDGPIALTSEFFSNVIGRSEAHQAKYDRNQLYHPYATYSYIPSMLMTEEDNDALSLLETDITSYTEEMRAKWLAYGGIDEEWDAYVERLYRMGLEAYIEIYQRNYTTAYGE